MTVVSHRCRAHVLPAVKTQAVKKGHHDGGPFLLVLIVDPSPGDQPPLTATGVGRDVVVPSPSWPWEFEPQQYAAPVEVFAQV